MICQKIISCTYLDVFFLLLPFFHTYGFSAFIIFGDYGNENTYVFLGRSNWKSMYKFSESDLLLKGENQGDRSGYTVEGVGDINGEGYNDFSIGAYQYKNRGKVYLFLGRNFDQTYYNVSLTQADASFEGSQLGAMFGYDIASAGDVDNNGYNDFLISVVNMNNPISGYGILYLSNPHQSNTTSLSNSSTNNTPSFLAWLMIPAILFFKMRDLKN